MMQTLTAIDRAAVLLDGSSRVVAMSERAYDHMGDGVVIVLGRFRATDRGADPALQQMLAALVRTERQEAGEIVLPLPRRAGRPLILRGKPITTLDHDDDGVDGPRALILLESLDEPPEPSVATLRVAFGLTPAEAEVASLIGKGDSAPAVSQRLGIALSTVRTHLKALFAKTDTNSQTHLALLISRLPTALPSGRP